MKNKKEAARTTGTQLVIGIQQPKALMGFPHGRVRIKMSKSWTRVYVKTAHGIRLFAATERNGCWWPAFEEARTERVWA